MPQTDAGLPEVARIAADLIRFDTSNFGGGDAKGEREAAEYVGAYLESLGLQPEYYEPIPRRTNVMARVAGREQGSRRSSCTGISTSFPRWRGLERGPVRRRRAGRHALGPRRSRHEEHGRHDPHVRRRDPAGGRAAERDLILVFFADEENGGVEGSALVVQNRPEWFAGASEAISEVGGYSIPVGDRRAYLLQVGEKALMWIRLIAKGRAGHGSRFHPDNAVTKLADAVAAIGRTSWPIQLTDTTRDFLDRMSALTGLPVDDPDALAATAGPAEAFLRSTLRTTTNPTVLQAGYKHNVIPERAEALIDVRVIPGQEEDVLRRHSSATTSSSRWWCRTSAWRRRSPVLSSTPWSRRSSGTIRASPSSRTCSARAPTTRRSRSSASRATASRR
jgi:acetylornithine deacetylase/succinyl-diaminopimelate desuccinylase-like protein